LLDIWHRHGTRPRCRVLRHQATRRLNLVKLQRQAPKILTNSGACLIHSYIIIQLQYVFEKAINWVN
jgi:hypothetical protein